MGSLVVSVLHGLVRRQTVGVVSPVLVCTFAVPSRVKHFDSMSAITIGGTITRVFERYGLRGEARDVEKFVALPRSWQAWVDRSSSGRMRVRPLGDRICIRIWKIHNRTSSVLGLLPLPVLPLLDTAGHQSCPSIYVLVGT